MQTLIITLFMQVMQRKSSGNCYLIKIFKFNKNKDEKLEHTIYT